MLGFDLFRKKIEISIPGKIIKHVVEHAADVVLAIVDDLFRFLVPKHGNSDALIKIGIGCLVGFAQKSEAVDWIG